MRRGQAFSQGASTWRRWELQADKTVACGTQAYALRPRLLLPCANPTAHGAMCLKAHGAAGAVKRPVFRTPLRGIKEQGRDWPPRAGLEEGR